MLFYIYSLKLNHVVTYFDLCSIHNHRTIVCKLFVSNLQVLQLIIMFYAITLNINDYLKQLVIVRVCWDMIMIKDVFATWFIK